MDELATAFDKLFEEFAVVFDGGLGCYKGPPVKLALNPGRHAPGCAARTTPPCSGHCHPLCQRSHPFTCS
ncbi:hypothetical protein MRX96_057516 [Rhipicephalus microplus]